MAYVTTFDGVTLEVAEMTIETESRLAEELVPGAHGAAAEDNPYLTPKIISIRGTILGASDTDLRTKINALSAALNGGKKALKLMSDRQIWCAKRSLSLVWVSLDTADYFVELVAKDPFFEAVTPSSSSGTAPHTPTIAGGGDAPSPPTITLTAPGGGMTDATIANTTTGKTFTWAGGSLTSGQTLVVDMAARTITEAGAAVYTHFSGDFWDLLAGNNTLNITSTPTGATVSVDWRARWYD